ncbi:MAG: N-6 DNA methylase [Gammaproteobacteria bacterium]|nr:N-6 DNA methylase [Gammaproteobacteria bacterium]
MSVTLAGALQATGYIVGDDPAPGLVIAPEDFARVEIKPDAVWRDQSGLEVVFKFASHEPPENVVASWQRDIWNLGLAPLLWVVTPSCIRLYNGFERPSDNISGSKHLLREFNAIERELAELDDYAGRFAMESGRFWTNEKRVQRDNRVDLALLKDLREIEDELSNKKLPRDVAQGIIGRSIFIRYLSDRGIVNEETMPEFNDLETALGHADSAYRLFDWVRATFNGDLFPIRPGEREVVSEGHLKLVSETLAGVNPRTGQRSLWEYRFEAIPIELISSIYEQFAHSAEDEKAATDAVHYTPMSVVNLVLDEVMRHIDNEARVLDLTCGSAVFLVEALRRLVTLRASGRTPTRSLIRETLKNQIFGVDKSESAIRVASFSLYLLALELDPDPTPPNALKFDPLIGKNLFVGNAFDFDSCGIGSRLAGEKFDVIIGNPPWTYGGRAGKLQWPVEREKPPLPPRSQDFAFVWRSIDFAHDNTRFGIVMRATPFFSSFATSVRARTALLDVLKPVFLVNLSALRNSLFPTADHPAVVVIGRVLNREDPDLLPVVTVPWSWTFERTGALEIAPRDVAKTRLSDIGRSVQELKTTTSGTRRDRILQQRVQSRFIPLHQLLKELGVELITGVQILPGDQNDSTHLIGLPMLSSRRLTPNVNTDLLEIFDKQTIHRPRNRTVFRAPLVIVSEGIRAGIARPAVGVSETDVVYSRSYYGMSFYGQREDLIYRLTGVLLSSVMAWHMLLNGSEYAIHKRRALHQDLASFPVPDLDTLTTSNGSRIETVVRDLLIANQYDIQTLAGLDEAVFDVYELDEQERLVVLDGAERGAREFKLPRLAAEESVSDEQLRSYARTFLNVINPWQSVLGKSEYSAAIVGLRNTAPLRVIRFVRGIDSGVRWQKSEGEVAEVLGRIGHRIQTPISQYLAAARELRVHGIDGEILVIKPASHRYWTHGAALNDADSALGDGLATDAQ